MFDSLGLEHHVDHVCGVRQSRFHVTSGVAGYRKHIAIQAPHSVFVGLHCDDRVIERLEGRIFNVDEGRSSTGCFAVGGQHKSQDVS